MKKLKHLMAVMLAMIMMLAMTVTAFAADPAKGSLTVKVNADNTLKGQTISVYKIFDLTVSSGEPAAYGYTVNATYKDAIATVLGKAETATSDELYEAIAVLGTTEIQKFADDFTAAALTSSLGATKTSGKITSAVQDYTFDDLDYGYYLVYQTGTEELQSSLVTVDSSTGTEVNLKGEAPSITKTANKDTVEIGDVVTYTVTGTIPNTTGYTGYIYKIHDTLTEGLDFVQDAQGTAQNGNSYNVSVKIGDGQASQIAATLSGESNRTMELDLSQWIRNNQSSKGQTFTVTYYAKVNKDAVVTTNNSAFLEYGNDPSNTTTTTPVQVDTPTYPLNINKTESKTDSMLAGATFRIYRSESDADEANNNAIKVTEVEEGKYVVAENQTSETNMDMVSKGSIVTDGVNLSLNGLKAGDYWLVETAAPDGYNKITAPVKVTIAESATTDVNNWTISKDNTQVTDKIIDIENSTGTILPGTGGMGTVLFTVAGVVLVLVIAGSFIISRRRRAE